MTKVVNTSWKTEKFEIGSKNGYYATVTFRSGILTQVSLYQGERTLLDSTDDRGIGVLANVVNETISVIDNRRNQDD